MFTTQGEIKIRSIRGRYVLFNIGTLVTDVGTFAIKDELISDCYSFFTRCLSV